MVEPRRSCQNVFMGVIFFCLDFRKLTKLTKKDVYPLPYMSSILEKLKNSFVLTSLDLKSAFGKYPCLLQVGRKLSLLCLVVGCFHSVPPPPFSLRSSRLACTFTDYWCVNFIPCLKNIFVVFF